MPERNHRNSGPGVIERRGTLNAVKKAPKPPTVRLRILSVEYAGVVVTKRIEKPSWRVTFELDGETIVRTSLTVHTIGASDAEAAEKAGIVHLSELARGLLDAALRELNGQTAAI